MLRITLLDKTPNQTIRCRTGVLDAVETILHWICAGHVARLKDVGDYDLKH